MTTDSRRTHVIRILGRNLDDEILPDIWLDIERIDVIRKTYRDKHTGHWQEEYTRLYWRDDPDSSDASWNKDVRLIGVRMVCPPEGNPADPGEYVGVNCIIATEFQQGDQGIVQGIRNDSSNETRLLGARRIYHRKTSIDAAAKAAFEADPTRRVYMVPGNEYKLSDAVDDRDQWIDVCVFSQSEYMENDGDPQLSVSGHWSTYLLDISDRSADFLPDPDKPGAIGPLGNNPPWVLDQFQNIVNVQWRTEGEPEPSPHEFWAQFGQLLTYSRIPVEEPSTPHYAWTHYGHFGFATAMYAGVPGPYENFNDYLYCAATMSNPSNPLYPAGQAYQADLANWTAIGEPTGFPPLGYITFSVSGAPYG